MKHPSKRRPKKHYEKMRAACIAAMNARWEDRFWARVSKTTSCWNWTGATSFKKRPDGRNMPGYGSVHKNGILQKAHRLSWEMENGPIPKGLWVLHKCDNRLCVRPSHLYLGDHIQNMKDGIERHRFSNNGKQNVGENNPYHKFSKALVNKIRAEYKPYVFGYWRLAKKYGMSVRNAQDIIQRRTWKHI